MDEQADPKPKWRLELLSEKVFFGVLPLVGALPLVVLVCLAPLGMLFYILHPAQTSRTPGHRGISWPR